MFYTNRLPTKKSKTKLVTLGFGSTNTVLDENLLSQSVSKVNFNCDGSSGALQSLCGIEKFVVNGDLQFSHNVLKVWHFAPSQSSEVLIAFLQDFNLYTVNLTSGQITKISSQPLLAVPDAVSYRMLDEDVMLFCSAQDSLKVFDGQNFYAIESAPQIVSMCVHYERIFGCFGNTLWFSDDLDPTNWNISATEAGYVEMADDRGKLLKVVSFADYLYVFREYGIARVSAYSSQQDFAVNQLFVTSGKIYPETVSICGDKILFLSQDGLYLFDGAETTKLLSDMDGLFDHIDNVNACAEYSGGKYYLSCALNFGEDVRYSNEQNSQNNAVVVYDFQKGNVSLIRGADVRFMKNTTLTQSQLLMCLGGQLGTYVGKLTNNGKLFDTVLPKYWKMPQSQLGQSMAQKYLEYVVLTTKADVTLEVECDGQLHLFEIMGSTLAQKVPLKLSGKVFSFAFYTENPTLYVSMPRVVYKTYSEEV